MIPPFIELPLIELSENKTIPFLRSNVLSKPISISVLSINPPSILLPLIELSENNIVPFLTSIILLLSIEILVLFIVPPLILFPLILLSDKNNDPFRKSNILSELIVIFVFSIVPPLILLPFIDFSGISRLFVFNVLVLIVPVVVKLLLSKDNSPESSLIKPDLIVKLSFNFETVNSFISILSIVPPLIAFPLIESFVNIISPPFKSNLLPWPILILILFIVPPLILFPLIDASSIKNSDFLISNTLFSPTIILLFCIKPELIITSFIVVFPISIVSIVPPLIAFPLIELSSNSKSLPIKFNWLPIPRSILTLSIVPP